LCLKNLFEKAAEPQTDYAAIARDFKEIAESPYNVSTNNCMQKAMKLAYSIQENHGSDVVLVQITHNSGDYRHAFILWQKDLAVDPTMKPPAYRVDYNEYLRILAGAGFTKDLEETRQF